MTYKETAEPAQWTSRTMVTLWYVAFGGTTGQITGERIRLGSGVRRNRGDKGWVYHFAFGYVSGFPLPSILYFLLTRCTTKGMRHWSWKRERAEFEARSGQSWAKCVPSGCSRCDKKVGSRG